MLSEKEKIRLDVKLVSSMMNHAGYKCLLNYLSLQLYKKIVKDEYVNFDKIKKYSFIEDENTWIHFMDKLVEIKLAVKNGNSYITKSKLTDWRKYMQENQKHCERFNGFLHFDMTQLYIKRKNEDLKDLIYLAIYEAVIKGKSISRQFIYKLTGIDKHIQRRIEKKHEGVYLELINHHVPVSILEETNGKLGNIPIFNGFVNSKHLICNKTSKRFSNCKVAQLGNKLKIKNVNLCSFEYSKQQHEKLKSNLDKLNKTPKSVVEVQDWETLSMVIDTSGSSKTIKLRGIISANDYRYDTWKDFKSYDYKTLKVISEDGSFNDIRNILNN